MVNGKRMIMIGSNNYLGLTTHPRVREAAIEAIKRYGTSCTGSRFLNGNLACTTSWSRSWPSLSARRRAWSSAPACRSTWAPSRPWWAAASRDHRPGRPRQHHRRLPAGLWRDEALPPQRHGAPGAGAAILRGHRPSWWSWTASSAWAATSPPCPRSSPLCKKYGARLMVDDAHSLGVLAEGRGTAAHFGLTDQVDLIMGTFSKSFASLGGVVVGDAKVIDYIQHHARSLIFSRQHAALATWPRCAPPGGHQGRAGARRARACRSANRCARAIRAGLSAPATARRPSSRSSSATT